jgi:cyclopropane fatty-acyl-phospholipid synthase-like methyltransferase
MTRKYEEYWNRNIDLWADKYLEISHGHESFDRPAWFTAIYNATVGRIERRLMKHRYQLTIQFIDEYVGRGTRFSDLGCGTGIFVVEAAKRGAIVTAVDFSESSLNAARKTVEHYAQEASVTFIQADVQRIALPEADVTLAMGVTPYLTEIKGFLRNVLPSTGILCCQYTDPHAWASVIRRLFPILDVRSLQCYGAEEIDAIYRENGASLLRRSAFASGYIDVVTSKARAIRSRRTDADMSGSEG